MAYQKKDNTDWDKVNREKREEITFGQAVNLVVANIDGIMEADQEEFNKAVLKMYTMIEQARLNWKSQIDGLPLHIAKMNKEVSQDGQKLELLK